MPLRATTNFSSLPIEKEGTIDFGDFDDDNDSDVRSTRPHSSLSGPEWNHQKSFYAQPNDTPITSPRPSYSSPAPQSKPFSYTSTNPMPKFGTTTTTHTSSSTSNFPVSNQQSYFPSAPTLGGYSHSRPASIQRPEMSLKDTIDVYVDNKYFKTHNLHYGPAVIRIGSDDNSPHYSADTSYRSENYTSGGNGFSSPSSTVSYSRNFESSASGWSGYDSGRGDGRGSVASGITVVTSSPDEHRSGGTKNVTFSPDVDYSRGAGSRYNSPSGSSVVSI